ncbi:MAG: hypothetical protein HUK04_00230 [Bacteroidaceae bacterium]|nr:hypothetical protein [Bacteroidaceae bacterium]
MKKTFFCVCMTILDKGGTLCHIYPVEAETKPESEFKSTLRRDVYWDYFDTKEEAQTFIDEEYD